MCVLTQLENATAACERLQSWGVQVSEVVVAGETPQVVVKRHRALFNKLRPEVVGHHPGHRDYEVVLLGCVVRFQESAQQREYQGGRR